MLYSDKSDKVQTLLSNAINRKNEIVSSNAEVSNKKTNNNIINFNYTYIIYYII
jgi:hypothetical protein